MPTPTKGRRLGGSPSHQRLMLANLAQSLFEHGRITTTETKARRLRPYAEQLITKAKVDTVANRRQVVKVVRDKSILHTLFTEIGPAMATRPGGYTRITKIGPRKGDNAPMAVIEIVESKEFTPDGAAPPAAPATQPAASADAAPEQAEAVAEPDVADATMAEETSDADAVSDEAASEDSASDGGVAEPDVDADGGDAHESETDSSAAGDEDTSS